MNYRKRKFRKVLSLIAAVCFLNLTSVYAQGPEAIDSDCLDCETTSVPFDGYVNWLVIIGIGYGVTKAYVEKKKFAAGYNGITGSINL